MCESYSTMIPQVVVLSRGRELRLETELTTCASSKRDVTVIHEETAVAIEAYNRLVDEGVRASRSFSQHLLRRARKPIGTLLS